MDYDLIAYYKDNDGVEMKVYVDVYTGGKELTAEEKRHKANLRNCKLYLCHWEPFEANIMNLQGSKVPYNRNHFYK